VGFVTGPLCKTPHASGNTGVKEGGVTKLKENTTRSGGKKYEKKNEGQDREKEGSHKGKRKGAGGKQKTAHACKHAALPKILTLQKIPKNQVPRGNGENGGGGGVKSNRPRKGGRGQIQKHKKIRQHK